VIGADGATGRMGDGATTQAGVTFEGSPRLPVSPSLRRVLGTVGTLTAAVVLLAIPGCSSAPKGPDKVTQELLSSPKEVLFEKGKTLIEKKKYEQGRKYLSFVFETYPNDALGRQSLLMVADSYFKEGGTAGYTEARFRYRDYLNRYPGAPRRDYARSQFALCYDKEHAGPDRDQTSTREAIEQYQALVKEFPDSGYAGAARERIRRLTDLLAEHEFSVGYFYFRKGATGAALGRFVSVEEHYPDYGAKDKLFYYCSLALRRLGRTEEAERYRGRLLADYPDSKWAKKVLKKGEKPGPAVAASVDKKAGTN
jgi:outer membrane assembly lipoprotein YfiO